MKDGYSLHQFLAETNATIDVIDYIIQTKYSYLLLINHERNAYVVINTDNYKSMELQDNIFYLTTIKPIMINGHNPIQIFELDIFNNDDIIGFIKNSSIEKYCKDNLITELNTAHYISSKLIFSPQLANYLLDRGFTITHLKKHEVSGETIFVFQVEKGFYETIYNYRQNYID